MIKDDNSRITITLPNELLFRVKKEAKKENRSVSNYIVSILLEKCVDVV